MYSYRFLVLLTYILNNIRTAMEYEFKTDFAYLFPLLLFPLLNVYLFTFGFWGGGQFTMNLDKLLKTWKIKKNYI